MEVAENIGNRTVRRWSNTQLVESDVSGRIQQDLRSQDKVYIMPPPSRSKSYGRIEELAACRFCIDIEGMVVAIFHECSGLSGEIEVIAYQEGGLNSYVHQLPGRASYGNVTLSSGVASAIDLWDWFYGVAMSNVQRRDLSIVMRSRGGEGGEVMRWNLMSAYPVRWEGPNLTAGDTNVAVHRLELAHHGIELMVA